MCGWVCGFVCHTATPATIAVQMPRSSQGQQKLRAVRRRLVLDVGQPRGASSVAYEAWVMRVARNFVARVADEQMQRLQEQRGGWRNCDVRGGWRKLWGEGLSTMSVGW